MTAGCSCATVAGTAPQPSPSTLLYLFGDRMFPPDPDAPRKVRVPSGAEIAATPLVLNVLLGAVLNLRDDGVISVELSDQAPPAQQQSGLGGVLAQIRVGKSSRCIVVAHEKPERPSVEGRILKRAAKEGVGQPVELWKAAAAVLRTGDENPWVKALECCRDEADDLGLIEVRGLLRKKVTADQAALAALEPQFERAVARLKRAETEEHELVQGIWEDCDTGLADRQVVTRSV